MSAFVGGIGPQQRFLLSGSRIDFAAENLDRIKEIVGAGEQRMRREWLTGKQRRRRGGEPQLLIWRAGTLKDANVRNV